ncbi:potassium-transporting ATPase subunit KdpC [Rhizosaccharibacter radicis]|uniref:Potassium-transporting ATPase KdpC subunit n=1 Tax=Rhizosaccharibacter radicis TaxID=2782605 RepID=A0ABT1VYR2_9PROT|nr:potassium-transporting ATPase subunit KdpC [Acetobacteraceae bacterium KSS12]
MQEHLRPALVVVALSTALLGIAAPLAFVGGAQALAPHAAGGSLLTLNGKIVGSSLIGQNFTGAGYFHGRPSATTAPDPKDSSKTVPAPYNAASSSGSNLAPTSAALVSRVKADAAGNSDIPADAVTTSASGLDPDISPENAARQVARVADARHLARPAVQALVDRWTTPPLLGIFGAARVDVLRLNMAMDAASR